MSKKDKTKGDLINEVSKMKRRIGELEESEARRKKREEALIVSEQKFRDLVETTSDWVWETNEEGTYTYVNPRVKDILGYEVREVLGRKPFDFMPEEEAQRVGKLFEEKVVKKESLDALVNTNQHKDGHLVILETSGMPLFDEEGRLRGYRGIDRDITQQEEVQEEMKRAYTAIETCPQAIFTSNLEARIIYANTSAARMWGFENPTDMVGTDVIDYWTEKSREKAKEVVEILIKEGSHSGEGLIGKRKDGTEFLVAADSAILMDSFGKPAGMTGSFQDITERKKAEEDLKESERYLVEAQAISQTGYWKLDSVTQEVTGSDELFRIFGLSHEGVTLETFAAVVHPEDLEYDMYHIKRGLEKGIPWDIEHRLLVKDGTEKWVHVIGRIIKDDTGKIVSLIGIVQDITERKKAEEKLKEYQEHLEELVKERTTELEEEILERKKSEELIKEQNERLKELDRMKSEFLSTAAHELRTPLTVIMGFSELLLEKKLDEERTNKFLKTINEESRGLEKIINDLLDVSRIESGIGFKIRKAPTDLGDIILKNTNLFQSQTDKHIFKMDLPGNLPKVEIDKDRIGQVIESLLSNAIKFSPEGGKIQVTLQKSNKDLKVTVSDTGLGISKKDLPRIFDRFYRGDNVSADAIGGVGLGLGIVKYIIELHKGKIWVESEPGKGSTFTFTLPTKTGKTRGERRV